MEYDLVEITGGRINSHPTNTSNNQSTTTPTNDDEAASLPSADSRFAFWNLVHQGGDSGSIVESLSSEDRQFDTARIVHEEPLAELEAPAVDNQAAAPAVREEDENAAREMDLTPQVERLATLLVSILILLVCAAMLLPDAFHMDGYSPGFLVTHPKTTPSAKFAGNHPPAAASTDKYASSNDGCDNELPVQTECNRLAREIGFSVCRSVGQMVDFGMRCHRFAESAASDLLAGTASVFRFARQHLWPHFLSSEKQWIADNYTFDILHNLRMAVFERSSDYYKEIVVLIEDFSPSSSSAGNSQFFLWLFTAAKSALNQIAIKVKQMSIKLYEQTVSLFMQKQS